MEYPKPLLIGATGHTLALGAIVMTTADIRIGTADTPKCKIGLNEVREPALPRTGLARACTHPSPVQTRPNAAQVHIGMPLPASSYPILRSRLSPCHLTRATTLGTIYSPEVAVEVRAARRARATPSAPSAPPRWRPLPLAPALAATRTPPRTPSRPRAPLQAGFLDELVPPEELESTVISLASKLAHLGDPGERGRGFRTCKRYERREIMKACRAEVENDVALFSSR